MPDDIHPAPARGPYDAVVVGGSYAGLSAALMLGRARRRVLVVDAGRRRNRFASSSHGFLSRDGEPAAEIAGIGREQLMAYPTVAWLDATIDAARGGADGFRLRTDRGDALEARRIVIASGVVDELPEVDGLWERWGRTVFHCPYCHGYEQNQGRIGVLASHEATFHQAMLLPEWGSVTLFSGPAFTPDADQRRALATRGVTIDARAIARIEDPATVVLQDGAAIAFESLFVAPRTRPAGDVVAALGCALEQGPLGPFVRIDDRGETSVPGVYACGDVARMASNIPVAVRDGAVAGVFAHQSLVFG